MNKILVTGASSFLGYHVAKRLNDEGIRPRVLELQESNLDPLTRLDVDRMEGHFEDAQAVAAACTGVDTVLHLAFKVSVAGGGKYSIRCNGLTSWAPNVYWIPRRHKA